MMPLLIPPLLTAIAMEAKLFNCPTNATPAGPMTDATTLTPIRPVNIFTNVEMAVKEKTLTISVFATCWQREQKFSANLRTNSIFPSIQ